MTFEAGKRVPLMSWRRSAFTCSAGVAAGRAGAGACAIREANIPFPKSMQDITLRILIVLLFIVVALSSAHRELWRVERPYPVSDQNVNLSATCISRGGADFTTCPNRLLS